MQPAAGDAGGALGAALASYHIHYNKPRHSEKKDTMKGSYLGKSFTAQTRAEPRMLKLYLKNFHLRN